MSTTISFPRLIDFVKAATGASRPEVQQFLHQTVPDLRAAWTATIGKGVQLADPPAELVASMAAKFSGGSASASADTAIIAGIPADVYARIRQIMGWDSGGSPASKSGSEEQSSGFTPIDSETVRKAHGLTREQWAARKQGAASSAASTTTSSGGEPDYFALIAQVKKQRGCDFATAAREVNRTNPRSWAAMLARANPGKGDFLDRLPR